MIKGVIDIYVTDNYEKGKSKMNTIQLDEVLAVDETQLNSMSVIIEKLNAADLFASLTDDAQRAGVQMQRVENVGLGGVLSGSFTDQTDGHEKITSLLETHTTAVGSWKEGGRGSIYDDIQNDTVLGWLDDVVPDNGTTQAMCSWMIGKDFREYIISKIKGEIK